MRKKQTFQQLLLGNQDSFMQLNETRTQPHTMDKNKLKMAERLKNKTRYHQTLRREYRQKFSDINLTNFSQVSIPKQQK